jgi:glycerol uptake facilitator-like aquaporin
MEEPEQLDDGRDGHAPARRVVALVLVLCGAAAAIVLIVVGVNLLTEIHGSECHGEFPICTTPSQESARQTLAAFCAVGVLAYLVAALPAVRARRFNWAHVLVGLIIIIAILALIIDPLSHLSSEAGSDQWFLTG